MFNPSKGEASWSCCQCLTFWDDKTKKCTDDNCNHLRCKSCIPERVHRSIFPKHKPSRIPVRDINAFKSGRSVRYFSSSFRNLGAKKRCCTDLAFPMSPPPKFPSNSPQSSARQKVGSSTRSSSSTTGSSSSPTCSEGSRSSVDSIGEKLTVATTGSGIGKTGAEKIWAGVAGDEQEFVSAPEMHRRAMAAWQKAVDARAIYTWADLFGEQGID